MGCTCDYVNIKLKTKKLAKEAIEFFAELLEEDIEGSFFDPEEIEIEKEEDGFWVRFEEEPLFNTWDDGEQIKLFVKEFIKKFPDEPFYLDNTTSFNNCGDTYYYEYIYDENKKQLTIRTIYSEDGGLYYCPECEEYFDDPLVYIDEYKKGETYTCPECGSEIEYDADETIQKIKLEDL